jgi:hypothetical protein
MNSKLLEVFEDFTFVYHGVDGKVAGPFIDKPDYILVTPERRWHWAKKIWVNYATGTFNFL